MPTPDTQRPPQEPGEKKPGMMSRREFLRRFRNTLIGAVAATARFDTRPASAQAGGEGGVAPNGAESPQKPEIITSQPPKLGDDNLDDLIGVTGHTEEAILRNVNVDPLFEIVSASVEPSPVAEITGTAEAEDGSTVYTIRLEIIEGDETREVTFEVVHRLYPVNHNSFLQKTFGGNEYYEYDVRESLHCFEFRSPPEKPPQHKLLVIIHPDDMREGVDVAGVPTGEISQEQLVTTMAKIFYPEQVDHILRASGAHIFVRDLPHNNSADVLVNDATTALVMARKADNSTAFAHAIIYPNTPSYNGQPMEKNTVAHGGGTYDHRNALDVAMRNNLRLDRLLASIQTHEHWHSLGFSAGAPYTTQESLAGVAQFIYYLLASREESTARNFFKNTSYLKLNSITHDGHIGLGEVAYNPGFIMWFLSHHAEDLGIAPEDITAEELSKETFLLLWERFIEGMTTILGSKTVTEVANDFLLNEYRDEEGELVDNWLLMYDIWLPLAVYAYKSKASGVSQEAIYEEAKNLTRTDFERNGGSGRHILDPYWNQFTFALFNPNNPHPVSKPITQGASIFLGFSESQSADSASHIPMADVQAGANMFMVNHRGGQDDNSNHLNNQGYPRPRLFSFKRLQTSLETGSSVFIRAGSEIEGNARVLVRDIHGTFCKELEPNEEVELENFADTHYVVLVVSDNPDLSEKREIEAFAVEALGPSPGSPPPPPVSEDTTIHLPIVSK